MSIREYSSFAWHDLREPTLRQHEESMEEGSKALLRALWTQHPAITSRLTRRMVGP